jgi:hypothetical protein
MGCCAGKEKSSAKYEQSSPMQDNGMGCIGKGFEEVRKDSKTVSVMLGDWEIHTSRLDTENQVNVGEGKFGVVFEAQIKKVDSKNVPLIQNGEPIYDPVIVKKLSLTAPKQDMVNFIKEMQVLKEVEHPHILKLVGVMTVEPPLAMLFECPSNGVLKSFLASSRNAANTILPQHQVNFACCISDAFAYLHDHNVVHKDLVCFWLFVFIYLFTLLEMGSFILLKLACFVFV